MPNVISSVTALPGALRVNFALGLAAMEDPAGKIALLVSQVNALISNQTLMISAFVSANASGATFSALSLGTFTALSGGISNFRASGPI